MFFRGNANRLEMDTAICTESRLANKVKGCTRAGYGMTLPITHLLVRINTHRVAFLLHHGKSQQLERKRIPRFVPRADWRMCLKAVRVRLTPHE